MREEYKFLIKTIYVKTISDNIEIASDDAANKKWEKSYKTFKKNIRNHLKHEQRSRCAFCRCRISPATSYANLEHLISKTDYPQFKTLPENLVYSCWPCNSFKNTANTITAPIPTKANQAFPVNSAGFSIVNPYLDNYEDHIEFFDEVIVTAKSGSIKGRNTIDFYHLYRPELAEERAMEFKLNQGHVNHQLLQKLTDTTTHPDVIDQVNSIIAKMPSWVL